MAPASLSRPETQAARRSPGRPRCDVTRHAVLAAAYELLSEGGLRQFTIEAVAARSGVARTTIYRWWPSKGALAMEGFLAETTPDLTLPQTESASEDMRTAVRLFARPLRGTASRILRNIIAEGQSDPNTIEAFRERFVEPRRAAVRAVVERGIARGEFRSGLDVEMILYSLFGALYVRMLLNESLDEDWVDRLCGVVFNACPEVIGPGA